MFRRVKFQNLVGTWKHGVGVPVGLKAKQRVGLFVEQSILNILPQKEFPPSFLCTKFKSTIKCASQPFESIFPDPEIWLQSRLWPVNLLQFPEGFVIFEKNRTPFGLTQIYQQTDGQLFGEAKKISTTSSLQRGSLQLLQVEIIQLSMLSQLTYNFFLS